MGICFQIEEYHRPRDIARAVDILSRFSNSARVLAGGTDIFPKRPGVKRIDNISHLVDISNLDLDYQKTETLGMQLVTDLVAQIEGKIELMKEQGTAFKVVF